MGLFVNRNYLHSFFITSTKKDVFSFIKRMKKKKMGLSINERKEELLGSKYSITIGKEIKSFDIDKIRDLDIEVQKDKTITFLVSLFDTKNWKDYSSVMKSLGYKMHLEGVSGGFDATPYYIGGNLKKEPLKSLVWQSKMRHAYYSIKWAKGKKEIAFKKKLEEIEGLLLSLGVKKIEIEKYCTEPKEFLFGKSIVEVVLLNDEDHLISWLKARLGLEKDGGF